MYSNLILAATFVLAYTSGALANSSIEPGLYTIISVHSDNIVKSYASAPSPLISEIDDNSNSSDVELGVWGLTQADQEGYSFKNFGLGAYLTGRQQVGYPYVIADANIIKPTTFAVESAGFDEFVIKFVNTDVVWTMQPVGQPADYYIAGLAPANGESTQRFRFSPVISA